jgi:hypothetical protein
VPEEVRFFGRSAVFGLGIAVAYWFLTYETAGTVLLLVFGLGSTLAAVALRIGLPRVTPEGPLLRRAVSWLRLAHSSVEGPFLRDPTRLPGSSLAPIQVGLGTAVAALGLVFGVWLVALGTTIMILGGAAWLREAAAESVAVERDSAAQPPVCSSRTTSARRTTDPSATQPARRRGSPARPR